MNQASVRSRLMTAILLAALCGLAVQTRPAAALDSRWRSFGPGGGTVTGLALDPQDSQRLYAVAPGGLYASRDGGQTWSALVRSRLLAAVVVDPTRPSTIYAGGRVILRSRNGGRSWSKVLEEPFLEVSALAVTPGRTPVVFALSQGTVRRSADGGETWATVFTAGASLGALAIDPRNPANVYLASNEGIFKSTDAGLAWSPVLRFAEPEVGAALVAVAPADPRSLVAIANSNTRGFAVWRSVDGGRSWRQVKQPSGGFYDRALVVDPSSPTKLFLAGLSGVVSSVNGGRFWTPISKGMPNDIAGHNPAVYSLAVDPRDRQRVYAGPYEMGVARSDNGGAQWSIPPQTGLSSAPVQTLAFHPLAPEQVFVSLNTAGDRGLRSADGGQSWSFLPRQITRFGLRDLAFDAADPALFYAATGRGVWKTADGGAAWSRLISGNFYRAATAGPGVILAANHCGLQRSADGGRTWSEALPCEEPTRGLYQFVLRIWTDPAEPDLIFTHVVLSNSTHPFGSRALKSTDRGATWQPLPVSNPDLFAVAPGNSRVLYAWESVKGMLSRSRDAGQTWQLVNDQRPDSGDSYFSLVVDARDSDTVYLATFRQLLWSRNGGRTLETLDPSAAAVGLITDRARPGELFSLPFEGGLFERSVKE